MSRESGPPERKSGRTHPRTQEIIHYYGEVINEVNNKERVYVPTYRQVAEKFGAHPYTIYNIAKKNPELQEAINAARAEVNDKIIFQPSKECAWFLGMLTGPSGAVDNKLGFVRVTNKESSLLQSFKHTGEVLLTKDIPTIKPREKRVKQNVNKSVYFFSKRHTQALGDFSKNEKTNSLKERHAWVLDKEYIDQFISGLFDSGGIIGFTDTAKYINFITNNPDVARFYIEMLVKIGVQPDLVTDPKNNEIKSVIIRRKADLKTFAEHVTSLNPEKQKKLDYFKNPKEKKKETFKATSSTDLFSEWKRLKKQLGHIPTSQDIFNLKSKGETPYSVSMYLRYFGKNENGNATFLKAKAVLEDLCSTSPKKAEIELKKIKIAPPLKYTTQQLLEEWPNIKKAVGDYPSFGKLLELYKKGKMKYHPSTYRRYFGCNAETGKLSHQTMIETVNRLINQTGEQQIFP